MFGNFGYFLNQGVLEVTEDPVSHSDLSIFVCKRLILKHSCQKAINCICHWFSLFSVGTKMPTLEHFFTPTGLMIHNGKLHSIDLNCDTNKTSINTSQLKQCHAKAQTYHQNISILQKIPFQIYGRAEDVNEGRWVPQDPSGGLISKWTKLGFDRDESSGI